MINMTAPAPRTDHFLRQSSGLVRAAKPLDVLVYNTGLISVGIAICLALSVASPYYPGASLSLSFIIGAALIELAPI